MPPEISFGRSRVATLAALSELSSHTALGLWLRAPLAAVGTHWGPGAGVAPQALLGGHCRFARGFCWGCLGPRPARPGRRANAQGQAELCGSCWSSTGLGAGGCECFMTSFDKADAGATFLQQHSQCLVRTDTGSLWLGSKGKESRAAHMEVLLSPSIPESFRLLPSTPRLSLDSIGTGSGLFPMGRATDGGGGDTVGRGGVCGWEGIPGGGGVAQHKHAHRRMGGARDGGGALIDTWEGPGKEEGPHSVT